jgi:dolichyl-phosphate-mannose--protein O-mannosyl transferase
MQRSIADERDPLVPTCLMATLFAALAWWRIALPPMHYFDEIHYVPAARKLLEHIRANPEHPIMGKTIIAGSIALFGDLPMVWRVPSVIAGGIGLFAFGRFVWFVSRRQTATLVALVLLATNFMWFVLSRIAMLDMFMAMFVMIGLWQFAAAIDLQHGARWRLALAGISLGLALGTKWSVAPLLPLPGLLFLVWKLRDNGLRRVFARDGGAVPGIGLAEAALWLGIVPLCIYWATFWPGFRWKDYGIDPWAPIAWHEYMLQLQDSVRRLHPYRSVWYEWIGNWRAIWFLYQEVDGAQRGIVLLGNPFTMLAGLGALVWGLWAGLKSGRRDALVLVGLYTVSLGFWALSSKPIQFFYHYLLPNAFMMAVLALALDALWRRSDRWHWLAPLSLVASGTLFIHFYPILSGAPLCCGKPSFEYWMWLTSWR